MQQNYRIFQIPHHPFQFECITIATAAAAALISSELLRRQNVNYIMCNGCHDSNEREISEYKLLFETKLSKSNIN